jgi:hypothetical protein
VLSNAPGTVVVVDDFHLDPPPLAVGSSRASAARTKPRVVSKPVRARDAKPKRSRANA